jgi:four helix bundle protein
VARAFTYRDLFVWKQGMTLVEVCYRTTAAFPADERFGLSSQIRRAAISIPVNVAEGRCRHTTKAFINHVSIALGSIGELETCLELSSRLGFVSTSETEQVLKSVESVGRLLSGLHRSLKKRLQQQNKDRSSPPDPSPQPPAPSPQPLAPSSNMSP